MEIYNFDNLINLKEDEYDKVKIISLSNKINNLYLTFYHFKNLTCLNLICSNLANCEIPNNLISLKKLTLSRCNLNEISKSLFNLTNLEYLDLSINNITTIPKDIKVFQKLKYLDISRNKLVELPKEIYKLKNLTFLGIATFFKESKVITKNGFENPKALENEKIAKLFNLVKIKVNRKDLFKESGFIYIYKKYMLIYNFDISQEIDDFNHLTNNCKVSGETKIIIPEHIEYLNIIKTNKSYIDYNNLPFLEYLQIVSYDDDNYELNNLPISLKNLSLINKSNNADKFNIKNIKFPFGCILVTIK